MKGTDLSFGKEMVSSSLSFQIVVFLPLRGVRDSAMKQIIKYMYKSYFIFWRRRYVILIVLAGLRSCLYLGSVLS